MPDTTGESIWTRPARGARGPQPEHSRAEIVAAAVALADTGGLSAASMRAVAAALGTSAGSLYRYLSSREDLLALMIDAALAEMRVDAAPTGDWLDDFVALAREQLVLYRRHPWLPDASLHAVALGPHTMDYFEHCLRIMAPLDRDPATKMEAVAMVTGVVSLFARGESATPAASPARLFGAATPQAHPMLIAALTGAAPAPPARSDLFERTLRGVLRGVTG